MSKRILVRGARQMVTLHGSSGPRRGAAMRDLAIIVDGALLIEDGLISQVGSSRRLENLREARSALEVNAAGKVVMPGFVDSHTHLIGGPPLVDDYPVARRGYAGAVLENVRAVRRMTKQRMTAEARQVVRQCIRHGTTTLEAKSGYGLDEITERKMLRALASMDENPLPIVSTYLGAHVIPPEFAGRASDYADWICRHMLPQIRRRRLANFVDVVCDADAFPPALARR
ncbi:MAG: amidohydrolase family protein, partial [Bryobacteraceae bacterium]